jgi:2-(1,2-epoxy-1,2-dihydrophenyl)acetyl-CoA isomerase
MSDPLLLAAERDGVLTLTLNRPEKLNALNDGITTELIDALRGAAQRRDVRVIVLRGAGRGFSSGQDLEAFMRLSAGPERVSVAEHLRRGYNVVATHLRTIEKPVIASINGIAAGVGLSLALACDLRIAADDAAFTLGFSKIGLIPDGGGSMMLPALVGLGRALELAWTSDKIDAAEAFRIGLVNRVVPAAELEAATQAYAARFAAASPVALALTKRAFNRAVLPNFAQFLDEEAELQEESASGPDLLEGVRAFMEKRKPAYAAR